jgi:hypothetical protein
MSLLSDEELNSLSTLVLALRPSLRAGFLELVAAKVSTFPEQACGPGLIHRLGIEAQRSILKGGFVAVGSTGKARRGKWG